MALVSEAVDLPAPEGVSVSDSESESTEETGKKKRGRPKGSTNKPKLDKLEADLTAALVAMSIPVQGVSPLTCLYLEERAEKNAKAIIVIASRNPRLRKGIERFIEGSSLIDLPITLVGVITCLQVERGGADPNSRIAQALKIDQLFAEIYPNGLQFEYANPEEEITPRGVLSEVE
jgi:hypothetical protein